MEGGIDDIVEQIKGKKLYLIGICGIPGSGKSHYADILHKKLQKSMIVPMDGFHLYRKDLSSEGVRFRGAAFTFDLQAFKAKIRQLSQRKSLPLAFPSFDHAVKDPILDAIIVEDEIEHVIVEGLYLFDKTLELDCWDCKIWIEADLDIAMDRVAKRHFACGIEPTLEASVNRANDNDRKNGIYVQSHTNFTNCHRILNNISK